MKRKGQLSIELLIIVAVLISFLSIIAPNIVKTKEAADYSIATRNTKLILDRVLSACEMAQISGFSQKITFHSTEDFKLEAEKFKTSIKISKGENHLLIQILSSAPHKYCLSTTTASSDLQPHSSAGFISHN